MQSPRPLALPVDPNVAIFMALVDRLEAVLAEETEALRNRQTSRIGDTGQRKRQGMLELGRVMRRLPESARSQHVKDRLSRFAERLEDNRRLLDVHLRAVRGVAEIIARSMRDMESDGTYSKVMGRA